MPFLYIGLIAILIAIDQVVKHLIVVNLQLGQTTSIIDGILSFTHLNNTGAAWSVLSGHQFIFVVIGIIALIVIAYMMFKFRNDNWYMFSLVLLFAGAAGNIIDRIRLGHVVDMFQLDFINFPIFNCADMFLTVGILLLAIRIVRE
ncbi:signal peptidase II [Lentilactobacillus sp. Marseille-Q4993]|uniref:signal peptidase II n=1 Tax=Lentilactobacillus sp. Marseille-Q4993 TaxID=3039492 RepID=UPI0024BC43CF|nr:signal peptidase II [Lentilactobacillus sp. Marseille-Q4993]